MVYLFDGNNFHCENTNPRAGYYSYNQVQYFKKRRDHAEKLYLVAYSNFGCHVPTFDYMKKVFRIPPQMQFDQDVSLIGSDSSDDDNQRQSTKPLSKKEENWIEWKRKKFSMPNTPREGQLGSNGWPDFAYKPPEFFIGNASTEKSFKINKGKPRRNENSNMEDSSTVERERGIIYSIIHFSLL